MKSKIESLTSLENQHDGETTKLDRSASQTSQITVVQHKQPIVV